jgi:crotonobetainyl-CoA:carnitine CoA-transferase CaiB-like acyl-CoA transferase
MGVRVLDLTRVLAGPFCTMLLADMAADVIKLELPGIGDDARQFPPFKDGVSLYYVNLNRSVLRLPSPYVACCSSIRVASTVELGHV